MEENRNLVCREQKILKEHSCLQISKQFHVETKLNLPWVVRRVKQSPVGQEIELSFSLINEENLYKTYKWNLLCYEEIIPVTQKVMKIE